MLLFSAIIKPVDKAMKIDFLKVREKNNMDNQNNKAPSSQFMPVWTLEIQTVPADVDKILDAVMYVYPLSYGRYRRNASISAPGM